MELRRLRYFVTVAEELHFGRAARRLHLSQPPLSMQIKALEEEVRVTLLLRNQRHVELTPAGEVFLKEARDILSRTDAAVEAARRAARGETGDVRVGFVTIADYNILPPVLQRFRHASPDIRLVLREAVQMQTIVSLVSVGLGVALIPASLRHLGRTGVVYKSLRERSPMSVVALAWRKADARATTARFVDTVRRLLQEGP